MDSNITPEQLLSLIADCANSLQKTQTNLKKCPKSRLTKGYIEARIEIIDGYWRSLKNAHQELVKITSKEEKLQLTYFKNDEFFNCEELYNALQGDLRDMMSLLPEKSNSQSDNRNCMESSNSCASSSSVHLPRIRLPVFSGDYENWTTFNDLFISLVHENKTLSDVQKLHYLKTSVTGEAETILKHIQVTSVNYSIAWETLKSRYGNRRLILNNVMKRLFNQKKMTSQSAVQLKCLLDTSTQCLNSLENLQISTSSWDPLIIYLLVNKLDPETHKAWEEHAYIDNEDVLPTWSDFMKFIESKFRTLELVTANTHHSKEIKLKERSFHATTPTTERKCIMCTENHTLCHCKEFIKMEPKERSEYIKTKNLCFNCLAPGHSVFRCRLQMSCRICKRRHHSLLHEHKNTEPAASTSNLSQPLASQHVAEEEELHVNTMITSKPTTRQGVALLATAVVEAINEQGHTIPLRALIDQGSQATFISEKAAQLLKLKRQAIKGTVVGVGSSRTDLKHLTQLHIRSRWDHKFSLPIQAYVMSKQLTTKLPTKKINTQSWPHLNGLDLADPDYLTPGSIDLLLGVKEYVQIMQPKLIKGPPGSPCAQKSTLGWILFGEIYENSNENILVMHHQIDIDDILKSIWEVEPDKNRHLTKDEKKCEDIYDKTTTRNEDGRYIVKLPFKTNSPQSSKGNTKEIATQRYLQLERRFSKSPDLKSEYTKVINDYIEQGYTEIIPESERNKTDTVYLPHHAVIRTDKETSKTRVVFDASCKNTINHTSLNDELFVGPQLQEDLRNLLMRWRMKKICFMADIQRMYLQILVSKEDTDFQRFLWRTDVGLQEYRLLRVTFGTAPAPYLAVKTLHRVADDEGSDQPFASQAIKQNFYMDDWLDGADDNDSAISLAKDVTNILSKGGFQLTKFASNSLEFMRALEEGKRSAKANVDMNLDGTVKALGIVWNLNKDIFQYNWSLPTNETEMTKRSILSDIQRLFDPLGWIAPFTVLAKMLMQKLWLERVTWDENVSETLQEEWRKIKSDFIHANDIKVERWLNTTEINKEKIQIHGFSDASMSAYAASVYIRSVEDNKIVTKLIAAKTKVAPLKTLSLPRLELCGALLLAKLMKQVSHALRIPTSEMFAWTDSSIVLAWLTGEPNRWKLFVANRVVEILEILNPSHWFHVKSGDNPADVATRGMLLSELKNSDLWWKGPRWLSETEIKFNNTEIMTTNLEKKTLKIGTYLNTENVLMESITAKFEMFVDLPELLKTITYCKRFLTCKKNKINMENNITTKELEDSLIFCVKKVQEEEYKEEIERLKENKQVKKRSPLRFLNPFLDERQILKCQGRLKHTNLPDTKKYPIILGNKNALTPFIVADAHKRTLHGGVQLMLCYLQSKFWILKAKSMVKKHIHNCLICARLRAMTKTQIMGHLPEARVTPSRPFLNSGVDFAGPFNILMSKGRGNKTTKAYVSIFVCMSTKATHLELVGDLSSEAFIGAFKRFVARRGRCNHLWSDQGRNFVGANKELRDAWNEVNLQFTGDIAQSLATEGTQWHFIPAYSPTFGGLWEAGVHSMKNHLKRIITTHLTYEEMTTILCQVEACLNSRPLCPLDCNDPDNMNPLTPGHFLIGEPPIVVPSPDLKDVRISSLSRWQHTQKLINDFWRRWQDEYLSRLQQRPKWLKKQEEFNVGDIVLIKTDNLPPGKWSLGRIVGKHPGTDGLTRVYSVKSGSSVTKRTVTKLCALPIDTT